MKNLRKILLSLFFGILINTSVQSITFAHGVLSAFSIFTNVWLMNTLLKKQYQRIKNKDL